MDNVPMPNSSSSSGGVKRQRTDEENTESAPCRSEPWFEDGNIVLEANSLQFRVHRGVLCAQSPVFRDMFQIGQPAANEPMVEGCPLVYMPDQGQDVMHVLKAFYGGDRYTGVPIPFAVVAAYLRLGSKYEIDALRREAVFRLHAELPCSFQALEEYLSRAPNRHIAHHPGWLFDVIALAHAHGLQRILPAAYYIVAALYTVHAILKGAPTGVDASTTTVLSSDIAADIVIGREAILRTLRGFWRTACDTCDDECEARKKRVFTRLWSPVPDCKLALMEEWDSNWEIGMCAECLQSARDSFQYNRERVWEELPGYFGLPAWAELEKIEP
ncbi:hypothetical protein PLICRDRAFT_136362 [Plicaturopsis crispa FD-325 SS-3]|nr:hypothetical protein PLICRDRAFT_136362 [Plicaturopsis crispa FD-325 SS-3]